MNKLNRFASLALLAVAAIICYSAGFSSGVVVFVFLGMFFESVFWIKLLWKKRKGIS